MHNYIFKKDQFRLKKMRPLSGCLPPCSLVDNKQAKSPQLGGEIIVRGRFALLYLKGSARDLIFVSIFSVVAAVQSGNLHHYSLVSILQLTPYAK